MPDTGFITDYLVFWYVLVSVLALTVIWVRHARRAGATLMRVVVGNALVLATLLSATALAGETWFRYVYDETDSYGLTMTNWAWFHRHFEVNSWGMRDREWQREKAEGVERIGFVGDSFAAGYGVPDTDDRFPDRVGRILADRGTDAAEVWNAGGIGWSTGDELGWLRDVQPTAHFDRVVLAYCLNDSDDLLTADERLDRRTVPRMTALNPWQSFLFDFLWFRVRMASDDRVDGYFDWVTRAYDDEELWRKQAERIGELGAFCAEEGIALDVVVFPLFNSWGEGYPFDRAHDHVVTAFEAAGARVLDLRPIYAGLSSEELVVNRFDAHPNERAHGLAADAIVETFFPVE
jgi:hypothetical protein